jgi:hypothetical protein
MYVVYTKVMTVRYFDDPTNFVAVETPKRHMYDVPAHIIFVKQVSDCFMVPVGV